MAEDIAFLRSLCDLFPTVQVTKEDSYGGSDSFGLNCEDGTNAFAQRFFPSRESVSVAELRRFLQIEEVRMILWKVLIPLAGVRYHLYYRVRNSPVWAKLENEGYASELDAAYDKDQLSASGYLVSVLPQGFTPD